MRPPGFGIALLVAGTVTWNAGVIAATRSFDTPEAAMTALVDAVEKHDFKTVEAILGPELRAALVSDAGKDEALMRQLAVNAARRRTSIEPDPDDATRRIAYLGEMEWPFPAPLVPVGKKWRFDPETGIEEITHRRVGRNELAVIDGCIGYVDAQLEYASEDRDDDGMLEFAVRVNSHAGKMDGLYWDTGEGQEMSPIGPFGAAAAWGEEVPGGKREPLSGYYFRILTAQGASARGGARNYLVGDDLLGGFAIVAWPAEYGRDGIKTFLVNQLGDVYEQDLGPSTDATAKAMTTFDPDAKWAKVSADILLVASGD